MRKNLTDILLMRTYGFIGLITFVLYSCTFNPNKGNEEEKNIILSHQFEEKAVIVIPQSVCHSCIQQVIEYMNENEAKNKYAVAFIARTRKDVFPFEKKLSSSISRYFVNEKKFKNPPEHLIFLYKEHSRWKKINVPDDNIYSFQDIFKQIILNKM